MEYVTKITLKYENKNVFRCLLREVRGDMRFLRMEKMKLRENFFAFTEKKPLFWKKIPSGNRGCKHRSKGEFAKI